LARALTQRALAAVLEMSVARVSRVVSGGRLSIANCLRLADFIDERAEIVLRAYGYEREAVILERATLSLDRLPRAVAALALKLGHLDAAALKDVDRIVDRMLPAGVKRPRKKP
jgi:transcriptional regulator with XRE-family HTH domain